MAPPVGLDQCNRARVESAIAAPGLGFAGSDYYPTMPEKVAIQTYRLLKGHPCPDGNKRVALLLASAFLELNGLDLEASGEEIDHVFRTAAGSPAHDYADTLTLLAHWFSEVIRDLDEEDTQWN